MRSRNLFFVIALVAAITTIAFLAGCSSDKSTTPAADDSGYDQASAEFNATSDSLFSQFSNALGIITSTSQTDTAIGIAYSPVNPDSTVSNGGWHIVYASDIVAGYNRYLIDSIQFRAAGHPQDLMVNADQVIVIRHWGVNNPDTTVNYRNDDVVSSISVTGLNTDLATINGGRLANVQTKEVYANSTVKRTYTVQTTVNNITVPKANDGWVKGCPQSGSINSTVEVTIDRGAIPVTVSWSYDVTADNGTLTGTVTAGAVQHTFTRDACQM